MAWNTHSHGVVLTEAEIIALIALHGGGGGDGLERVVIPIGVWNMDVSDSKNVDIGLIDMWFIRGVQIMIFNDDGTAVYDLLSSNIGGDTADGGFERVFSGQIHLYRRVGGHFDAVTFDSEQVNRGFITFTVLV